MHMKMKNNEYGISHQIDVRLWTFGDDVNVSLETKDPTKNVVIDETALKNLNATLSEKLAGHNAKDPNVIGFLKEYTERWLDQFYDLGYVIIEDVANKE